MVARADWSEKRQQELVKLYRSGKTLAECCQLMKTGQVVVLRYLKQNGVETREAKKRGWSQEKIDRCLSLYQSGKTQREIAEIMKAGQAHVGKILSDNGIVFACRWTAERIQELVDYYGQEGTSISDCCKEFRTNGSSVRKYLKLRNVPIRPQHEVTPKGKNHHMWKGGRCTREGDYVYLKAEDHPNKNSQGYVAEHRLVMEEHLGRYLEPQEVVHHIDKDKQNNSIENLELFATNGEHLAHELKGQIPKWSGEGKERIRKGHQSWCKQERKILHPKSDDHR